jgi:hypothetical protein
VAHSADGRVVEGAFRVRGPGWEPAGEWYRGVHTRVEAQRGLAADEDVWFAGRFAADLVPGSVLPVSAWAGDLDPVPPPAVDVIGSARRRAAAWSARRATGSGPR